MCVCHFQIFVCLLLLLGETAVRDENALQDPGKLFFFVPIYTVYLSTIHIYQINGDIFIK
jgi:hypothetical protein